MRKAVLGLCFLLLCYSVGAAHAQHALKVGLVMSFTASLRIRPRRWTTASSCTTKQHGDTGCGPKITLIRKDTAGAPDAAKRLAQELGSCVTRSDILAGFVLTPEALTSPTFPPKRRSSWWS
jgi:branched-chain amino acid transport system substrate-binding protein